MRSLATILIIALLPIMLPAQQIRGLRSSSQSDFPRVQWWTTGTTDSLSFQIFRAAHNEDTFEEISTTQNQFYHSDTLVLEITDTSLVQKGIWQYYIRVKTIENVLINSDIMFAHNMGYLAPPEVFNLRTRPVADTKAIALSWELRSPATVVSQTLFRSRDFEDDYEFVTRLPATARSFVDQVPRANEPWFYFILIQDFFGYQPPGTRVHGFATFAEKPSAPVNFTASQQGLHVMLNWEKTGENIFSYRLYRRINQEGSFLPLEGPFYIPGKEITKTDSLAITPDTRSIEYYSVAISDGYLESSPSDTLILYIAENMEVSPPSEVDYVSQPNGSILLFWTPAEDFSGVMAYNLYRKTNDEDPVKLNHEPLTENTYLDTIPQQVDEISYQIEALNPGGKPSVTRTTISLEPQRQHKKLVLSCRQVRNGIQLEWVPLRLEDLKTLQILRQEDDEEPTLLTRIANERGTYTDTRTTADTSYIYYIVAEMNDGTLLMVNDGVVVSRY